MRLIFAAVLALACAPQAASVLRGSQATTEESTRVSAALPLDADSKNRQLSYGCGRILEAKIRDPSAEDPEDCGSSACGVVRFACSEEHDSNGLTEINYSISGLTPGKHALHVHQFRVGTDDDDSCTSTGGHWNPEFVNHGGNLNDQRHIGDLGNILADESGLAEGSLLAYVPLRGSWGVRNRAVVVHAGTDDLGTGGDDGSRAVGNAGARPGCGNIREIEGDDY